MDIPLPTLPSARQPSKDCSQVGQHHNAACPQRAVQQASESGQLGCVPHPCQPAGHREHGVACKAPQRAGLGAQQACSAAQRQAAGLEGASTAAGHQGSWGWSHPCLSQACHSAACACLHAGWGVACACSPAFQVPLAKRGWMTLDISDVAVPSSTTVPAPAGGLGGASDPGMLHSAHCVSRSRPTASGNPQGVSISVSQHDWANRAVKSRAACMERLYRPYEEGLRGQAGCMLHGTALNGISPSPDPLWPHARSTLTKEQQNATGKIKGCPYCGQRQQAQPAQHAQQGGGHHGSVADGSGQQAHGNVDRNHPQPHCTQRQQAQQDSKRGGLVGGRQQHRRRGLRIGGLWEP